MFNYIRNLITGDNKRENWAALTLLIGAGIALLASLVLSIESLEIAKKPGVVLGCDLNSVVSCGGVARHWSATLAGFPNAFIGLFTLPVMVTIAVALLSRVKFPRWFMICAQIGASLGVVFAAWMLYMSLIEIGMLCPWCLVTDIGMLLIFYGLTRYNILTNVITGHKLKQFVRKGYDTLVLALIIVTITMVIILKFGDQLF